MVKTLLTSGEFLFLTTRCWPAIFYIFRFSQENWKFSCLFSSEELLNPGMAQFVKQVIFVFLEIRFFSAFPRHNLKICLWMNKIRILIKIIFAGRWGSPGHKEVW